MSRLSVFAHARRAVLLAGMLLALVSVMPGPAAAAASPGSEADRILTIAAAELGDRYAFASAGPKHFDCSGFVFFVYKQAGLLDRIGGGRKTVAGLHSWFSKNGAVSRSEADAQPGDVLIWGHNKHTGIYVGDGYAISALVNPWGVTRHKLDWIRMKVTAVLHVNLTR
jgi:cell wall-associated NlpC family hydrolase